ncbi:MAG: threonine/serine exporter family protein [Oscillibacter sp.]|nr:threonine/serine exporter family protein [Oscillibacter sp.]
MTATEYDKLSELAVDLGCTLMSGGAEIYRVEESMRRLLNAYRLHTAEVFAIPSCVIVSVTAPDGHAITRMRRIPAHGTDMELLERCNALCRALCRQPMPLHEAQILLDRLRERPQYSPRRILVGYVIAPAFFAPLFGGGLYDALAAALGGFVVGLLTLHGQRITGSNSFFRTVVCSAAASLSALALVRLGIGQHADVVTISVLMMLVPGLALTNAMREIMAGDTVSGLSRIADTILTGGAIALGAAVGQLLS